jgi:hypothetical protein
VHPAGLPPANSPSEAEDDNNFTTDALKLGRTALPLSFEINFGHIRVIKTCSYCGRDEPKDALACSICGTEFINPPAEKDSQVRVKTSHGRVKVDMSELDPVFEMHGGFSRPDWKTIRAFIENRLPKEDWGMGMGRKKMA